MADVKFTDLPPMTEVGDGDVLPIVDISADETQKITVADLRAAIGGGDVTNPLSSDLDADGHNVVGLPVYDPAVDPPPPDMSAAISLQTMLHAFNFLLPQWADHPASDDVDMDGHRITGLGEPVDPDDAARLTEVTDTLQDAKNYTDSELAGYVPPAPLKIQTPDGRTRVEVVSDGASGRIEIYRNNILVGYIGASYISLSTAQSDLTLPNTGHASIKSGNGVSAPFTSAGSVSLPSGVASYMQGIYLAKEAHDQRALAEWWAPVWTPVSNVDSVSNVECQYTRVRRAAGGSLVTLTGTITIGTEEAYELAEATVALPVALTGGAAHGTCSVIGANGGIYLGGARIVGSNLSVLVQVDPHQDYTASFSVSYRAA